MSPFSYLTKGFSVCYNERKSVDGGCMKDIFREGDRVMCIKDDSFSEVGWTGRIVNLGKKDSCHFVRWDNYAGYYILSRNIRKIAGKDEELE